MTTDIATASWPPPPGPDAALEERLAWYPAVARLAPSKHNTQPWDFVVVGDSLELWANSQRALETTDPQQRELVISCGAAQHHLEIAAAALGHELSIELLPQGADGPLARVAESGAREVAGHDLALLQAAANRRTDRGPLDARGVAPSLPFVLQTAAAQAGCRLRLVATAGERAALATLVERADRELVRQPAAEKELQVWLRGAADHRRDGVPRQQTRGPAASYRAEFVQRDFSGGYGGPSAHDRHGPDHPVIGVLVSDADGVADWLIAGRALSAVLLEATAMGANASYLNQPIEVPALRVRLRSELSLDGVPQLILRLGAGGSVLPTPRRSLEAIRTWAGTKP